MSEIIFRTAYASEWDASMQLAWDVFMEYDAPDYSEEGIKNFREFVTDSDLHEMFIKGLYQVIVAVDDGKIVGVISVRNNNHISLLFVDGKYHKQGVGAGLIHKLSEYLYCEMGQTSMTVNSSPYAVGFYHKLGFADTGSEQTLAGIVFTPMELII